MKSSLTMSSSIKGRDNIIEVSHHESGGFVSIAIFNELGAPETILIDRVGAKLLISFLQSYVERSGQPAGVPST
jgi:hypothetical protein